MMTRNATPCATTAAIGLMAVLYGGVGDAFARLVEVTDCTGGDAAENGVRYVLTSDVDCSGEAEPVLLLGADGVLDLGRHTLSRGDVLCSGACRIVGPGTIRGGGVIGNGNVTVRRATITGSPSNGVLATNAAGRARARIIDSVIEHSAMTGVEADRMTKLIRSRIVGNGRHGVAVSLQGFNDCRRGRIRSWGSTIGGNGLDVACVTSQVCADVASCARRGPVLHATECDTSYELESGMPGRSCGVCLLD